MRLIMFRERGTGNLLLKCNPKDVEEKILFNHCADGDTWPNRNTSRLRTLLYIHGVHEISTSFAKSAITKKSDWLKRRKKK